MGFSARLATLALCLALAAPTGAAAQEWLMVYNAEGGEQCGPPLEADGVVLTPEELLSRFDACSLVDETPSLDLDMVIVACEGDIGRAFIFAKNDEVCQSFVNR